MSDARSAFAEFHQPLYIRHNQRRLEHLATLGLDLRDKTVLEPGAGIGDHTLFYLDRGCTVTALEPRPGNCAAFRDNVGAVASVRRDRVRLLEEELFAIERLTETFDVVHAYGLLYHLADPARAIAALAARTHGLLLLETCVTMGEESAINPVAEPPESPSQAADGRGCRPTRRWIHAELLRHLPHVYLPTTQPSHDEFPTDWAQARWPSATGLTRSIFIGSRAPLRNPLLVSELPRTQTPV